MGKINIAIVENQEDVVHSLFIHFYWVSGNSRLQFKTLHTLDIEGVASPTAFITG